MTQKPDLTSRFSNETQIDLGDDLLEKTAVIPGIQSRSGDSPEGSPGPSLGTKTASVADQSSIDDLLHSARILEAEGMVDDAKKILHQILIAEPGNSAAIAHLERIQDLEIRSLFRDGENITRRPLKSSQALPHPLEEGNFDPEEIMKKLDRDLGLGVFPDYSPLSLGNDLTLFQSEDQIEAFELKVEKALAGATVQDWIDMGIGFLEIDFYQIALALFSGACRKIDFENPTDQPIAATSLLALTLIQMGRPFDAISKLQPLLINIEIQPAQKLEVFYLMGRTYEILKKNGFGATLLSTSM
jgi:tetratricopeptide (TPR) repeat protein